MKSRVLLMLIAMVVSALPASAEPPPAAAPGHGSVGRVVETMNSGGYTYIQMDDGSKKIWAAAPQFTVAVGDQVSVPEGMPMPQFHSKTLDRTFDVVYFVPEIQVLGNSPAIDHPASAHNKAGNHHHSAVAAGSAVDLANIRKTDGGQTVAQLYADKDALAGKEVAVRGRVVKFTPAVMGKNWIHVQDGSGNAGSNDLTVSTAATAAVGNTVVVRGKLATDRDLGYGYHYDIIIEDAAVAVE